MTAARSFVAAFAEACQPFTAAEELRTQRDTARDWATALENRTARVEAVCAEVEADDAAHLDRFGQHLPGSVVRVAELVRAALTGGGDDARP